MYGIDVADPGAVPGASTNHPKRLDARGRNRIDVRNKDITFAQHDSAVNGSKLVNANDNEAFAVAA